MNDYKQECFKRLEYTQKYSKYNEEDLIEEIIEKDKQLDKYKNVIDKIKEYIKENIADIEFMEENYDLDFLNKNEIEVEYKDIKKLIELLEEVK